MFQRLTSRTYWKPSPSISCVQSLPHANIASAKFDLHASRGSPLQSNIEEGTLDKSCYQEIQRPCNCIWQLPRASGNQRCNTFASNKRNCFAEHKFHPYYALQNQKPPSRTYWNHSPSTFVFHVYNRFHMPILHQLNLTCMPLEKVRCNQT
jgi:hypothetical protein